MLFEFLKFFIPIGIVGFFFLKLFATETGSKILAWIFTLAFFGVIIWFVGTILLKTGLINSVFWQNF